MSSLVVITISKSSTKIKGKLQRLMLEIRPGTFVWKLSTRTTKLLWSEITKSTCSATCIFSAKNEVGFVIATHGINKREVISNYGIPLIKYKKKLARKRSVETCNENNRL